MSLEHTFSSPNSDLIQWSEIKEEQMILSGFNTHMATGDKVIQYSDIGLSVTICNMENVYIIKASEIFKYYCKQHSAM